MNKLFNFLVTLGRQQNRSMKLKRKIALKIQVSLCCCCLV